MSPDLATRTNWPVSWLRSAAQTLTASKTQTVRALAFFCTEGGSGEQRVFAGLQRRCGRAPVATLAG